MESELGSAMYEVPRKPKFDKDFIMLSEFSELVGPVPVVSNEWYIAMFPTHPLGTTIYLCVYCPPPA
jgi:hypothetical protein